MRADLRARAWCALAPVLLALAPAAARAATAAQDPSCGVVTLVAREGARAYVLPHSFIHPGSDSVWSRAGPLERGTDYELDTLHGQIRFTHPPQPGDTIWFSGCWLLAPPPFGLKLMRYRPLGLAEPDSASLPVAASGASRPAVARNPGEAPPGASLSISGNKTIAVDFGSAQDAFLRQSLDLAISGTLAPGVQLTGVLSDRNTPLTGTGSTRDLQSLDRVRIELKTPQGSAALGDVDLALNQGEFGRLERRLQGVRGDFGVGGFQGTAAAASAQGVYQRVEFFGAEGRQGPYTLRTQDGTLGISVVIGSEVVMLDGTRMTRGEGADYSIDYDRAEITFTNRRPITSNSRITVECQFTVNRFRRNLAAIDGRWQGRSLHGFTRVLSEGDDGGRPLDIDLDAADRLVLEFAGDSAGRAIAPGVTPGGGDYDSVRVAGRLVYAFAGPDSGQFALSFARVGAGRGDYADSAVVSGRTTYRYAGQGGGAFIIGRALPMPETHRLWAVGGGAKIGPLSVDAEGAVSKHDLNALSPLDDQDDTGMAGRATLGLDGKLPWILGAAGLSVTARTVGPRFAPFSRLERPFAQEDWGLPLDADLEHQQRLELGGRWAPGRAGELRGSLARLDLPSGFQSVRRTVEWTRDGALSFAGALERADANDPSRRYSHGGRDRTRGEARLRLPWLEPAFSAESDERRTPSDTARAGERVRQGEVELASPQRLSWHARAGYGIRGDATLSGLSYVDLREARTLRFTLDTPTGAMLTAGLALHRQEIEPRADPLRTRSDLGSIHVALDDARRALTGSVNLEITSEGESHRSRTLTFVGGGRGGFDALGNPVVQGDYVLSDGAPDLSLDQIARSAMSAHAGWQFGSSDAWRGSRVEFAFETDARRLGEFVASDAVVSPGAVLGDPALARGSVLQRLEADLAPGARAGALHLLAERRVSADRSYENYSQTADHRALEARLRARPTPAFSAELSSRLRRDEAAQAFLNGTPYSRVLIESGGGGQLVFTPSARLRAAGMVDGAWVRPEGGTEYTRTIKVGPDLGVAVLARGRFELSARRSFIRGPAPATYLPGLDPLGTPQWEGTSRFDYRLHETTTLGLSFALRDVPRRAPLATGRAELRAFF